MSRLPRIPIDVTSLRAAFGFGVAGNVAGHLEQAGEAADFANVQAAAALPKGIFPWYVPGADRLGEFPLSSEELALPPAPGAGPLRVQLEPELGVLCDVERDGAGAVAGLVPRWVAAFDDCSVRRPGAAKISDKKHWGAASKGVAATGFATRDLDAAGSMSHLRLACFLRRGDHTHAYGVDTAICDYTLFGDALLEWLVDRLLAQRGSTDTPLEDVGALLDDSGATTVLVGVGAPRYEPYGETTFVEAGDEAIVVLYDATVHAPADVAASLGARAEQELAGASVLRRIARPSR